jgi:exopolyphosphatase/guanosine-5'-triphosphate,3'-diphosphate pyrophosphatase
VLTHTRRAAIDVGTNTVRLLVVEGDTPDGFRIVHEDQVITRLGHGLTSGGPLHPESARRTLAAVSRLAEAARAEGAREVLVVGTSALRQARDRGAFAEALREATGLDLRVVSGEDEARLALLGTRWGVGLPPRFLLMDIGGGSTELVVADGDAVGGAVSLPLGAVYLTEAFLTRDPVDGEEYAALVGEIRRQLGPVLPGLVRGVPAPVVGTAGTVTTLAALDLALPSYDGRRVQGHQLRRSGIEALLRRLAPLPVAKRAEIPCLEPGRADLIIAGIAVCLEVLTGAGVDRLIASDYGLREGILLDRLRRAP